MSRPLREPPPCTLPPGAPPPTDPDLRRLAEEIAAARVGTTIRFTDPDGGEWRFRRLESGPPSIRVSTTPPYGPGRFAGIVCGADYAVSLIGKPPIPAWAAEIREHLAGALRAAG